MSDSTIATVETLTAALKDSRYLFNHAERTAGLDTEVYAGDLRYPRQAAEELYGYLEAAASRRLQEPPVLLFPAGGDPEVRAMQAIADALAPFGTGPSGAAGRILRWACDRYLVACPSCGGT